MSERAKPISPLWAEKLYPSVTIDASPLDFAPGVEPRSELHPGGLDGESIKNWILSVCRRLEIKPTVLAKKAGLAPSTVNRFISGKAQNKNVSATTVELLAVAASKIYAEKLSSGELIHGGDLAAPDPLRPLSPSKDPMRVLSVPVVGAVEAGAFHEAVEWPEEDRYLVHVPVHAPYYDFPVIALEVRGKSMNRVYPEGSIVLCVPFYRLDRNPVSGERVVVHRKEDVLGIEATVKEFQVDPQGHAWLLPLSDDPDHQRAIYLGTARDEPTTHEFLVTLLVVGSYRREPSIYAYA